MLSGAVISLLKDIFCCAGYISTSAAFPRPLSTEEEKECIERYKNGDEEARNTLIERNLRLVAHIAKKFAAAGADSEDIISVGTIGLIKGINSFDFNKSKSIANYAAKCIENEMLMFLRASKKSKSEVSLSDPIGTDKEGNSISLMDVICTDESSVDDRVSLIVQAERLYGEIDSVLSEREKTVVSLRYGLYGRERLTQRETARLLDISRSYVSRIEKKAVEKLSRAFLRRG